MKINIYYGGRGLMDDPTLFVINHMQTVLQELNVKVERYMLGELKNSIITLPNTIKEADGIILATTVEWYGIGGYMQQFLDACWLYGDKEKISKVYMCPIVMSTTYGEREGKLNLSIAWEILGGKPCSGLCGYIADTATLEMNKDYIHIIEKVTENMYRTVNQKPACLPASNQAVKKSVYVSQNVDLTPQESERLSQHMADEEYVQQQKEDIQELANMFRGMMGTARSDTEHLIKGLSDHFMPVPGMKAGYNIYVDKDVIGITVNGAQVNYESEPIENADVEVTLSLQTMNEILAGRMTFQRAFMSGDMKEKGDFKILRALDELFRFR